MSLPIAILSQRLLGSCEGKSILVKEGISPIGYGFLHANCTVIDESFDAKASYWSRTKFRANIVQDGASEGVNAVFSALPFDAMALMSSLDRSEERRVGKECVSPCRSRWSPYL